MAAVIWGHTPCARGGTTALGWSLRRVQRKTASGWQGHIPGRSPSHAGWGGPTRERGTISGPTTLGVWGRGTAMTTGVRLRRSTMATGTRPSPAVVLRARAAYWAAAISSKPLDRGDDEALESRTRDRLSLLASGLSPAGLLDLEQPSARFVPDLCWAHDASQPPEGLNYHSLLGSIFLCRLEEPVVGWGEASPIRIWMPSCIFLKKASCQSFIIAWTSGGAVNIDAAAGRDATSDWDGAGKRGLCWGRRCRRNRNLKSRSQAWLVGRSRWSWRRCWMWRGKNLAKRGGRTMVSEPPIPPSADEDEE